MTKTEAIAELKQDIELENDFTEDYINAVKMGIEALEQEDILDKLRAEIVELTKCPYDTMCLGANCPSNTDCMICGDHVLEIIDKYMKGGAE